MKGTKHQKTELVFDREQREDFLTGFSKRKKARKKAGRLQAERQFKEEVQRIKQEKRDKLQQRLDEVSSVRLANGIELTKLAQEEKALETVLDLPQHTVTITCAEEMDLTKDSAYLGANKDEEDCVEVVDMTASGDVEEKPSSDTKEQQTEKSGGNQKAPQRSQSRLLKLEKKTQLLKGKKKPPKALGRISKSQKKFLRKKKRNQKQRQ